MPYSEKYKRILHRLGYYNYQQGLIYRHLSQDSGWNGHLENCRNYIINAVNELKPIKVAVLGSGWLLDLPLAEMLDTVKSVTLIDIVHPPEARKQVSTLKGVDLSEDDVTGGLAGMVWDKAGGLSLIRKADITDDLVVPGYLVPGNPDLVISLNILSQLDVLPVEFLKKRTRTVDEKILCFRKTIQEKHLDTLSQQRSLLITDFCEIFTGSDGKINEVQTVIADLPAGKGRKEWTWDFDLRGSDYYEKRSVMKVVAMMLP